MMNRWLGQRLEVSAIGIGCMPMGAANINYGTASREEGIATIREAVELGCTFFDTAQIYGPFTNEELLGRALAGRWGDVVIASKFGLLSHRGGDGGRRRSDGRRGRRVGRGRQSVAAVEVRDPADRGVGLADDERGVAHDRLPRRGADRDQRQRVLAGGRERGRGR